MTYDLIVFGATSFVGKIICRYLLEHYPQHGKEPKVRWAVAARSQDRLQGLFTELEQQKLRPLGVQTIIADASDESSLRAMCARTRVVISTVGPYALYGSLLVKVCAELGVDYCDLTGEPHWVRAMIAAHAGEARRSGARIVNSCGFDSVPSDMGVWAMQREAQRAYGEPCTQIRMRVKAMKGGASGGTVASLVNVVKEAATNSALRRELANPYSLCEGIEAARAKQHVVALAEYDDAFKCWVAPFVMGPINTRVVLRSHALMATADTPALAYEEAVMTGAGLAGRLRAAGLAIGIGGFMAATALGPSRWALEKFVLPAPGEGPSPKAQESGFYDLRFFGQTASGKLLRGKVTGDRDPGYGSTAKMLSEAAIALALQIRKQDRVGGFWTPAALFGDVLLKRLQDNAGLTFEVRLAT